MRVVDRFLRFLVVLALAFAAPALSAAPAQGAVAMHHHEATDHAVHAGDAHAGHAQVALHDCGDAAPASGAHHATPDCLICCCALATVLTAPDMTRVAVLIASAERADDFHSLNRPPPAPPPRG